MCSSCSLNPESHFNLDSRELRCPEKNKNCLEIGRMRDETMKSEYDRQPSWVENIRRCVFAHRVPLERAFRLDELTACVQPYCFTVVDSLEKLLSARHLTMHCSLNTFRIWYTGWMWWATACHNEKLLDQIISWFLLLRATICEEHFHRMPSLDVLGCSGVLLMCASN